jgi:NAD(P)-dependent dehydrogenase (short-subunit alcohol dehydrogenase family)
MSKLNWLITGVSSGLGKALAEAVIGTDDFVVGSFRKEREVQEFNKQYSGRALAILLDVTDISSIDDTIRQVISTIGHIDVLVNNAGIGFIGAIEEASIDELRSVFEVNFFGMTQLTQSVLPHMRARQSGHIVQISSHAGIKATAGFGVYNASKFAMEGLSEALAQELSPLGIRVTIIEPGPFRTNFAGRSLNQAEQIIADYDDTAGAFRQKLRSVHDQQEGDPVKAAQLIIDHVNDENATLRLALGSVPLKTIGMKIDSLQSDLDRNRETSLEAVY